MGQSKHDDQIPLICEHKRYHLPQVINTECKHGQFFQLNMSARLQNIDAFFNLYP